MCGSYGATDTLKTVSAGFLQPDEQPGSRAAGAGAWWSRSRIVGFDVGDRRIGLAISDPLGYTAQPLFTLHRAGKEGGPEVGGEGIAKAWGEGGRWWGILCYMSGDQSPQAAKAQAFAEELRTEFGVHRASVG